MLLKCCTQYACKFGKLSSSHRTGKGQFSFQSQRREAKGKGERERYLQLDAEFQKIAGRDKQAFLSEQCKGIEENNRMRKTRATSKNWRCQGNISCKDGNNKGQKQQRPNRSRQD